MGKTISVISPPSPLAPKPKRVAAYARVSCGKDAMLHSLSAQVSYYTEYIQQKPNWAYVGVYSDEAFTGTKDDRPGFQALLADCREGLIDIVLTKSISRFARNTVTILSAVRELKVLGIEVIFEEENLSTKDDNVELMLSIHASCAQEESRSVSENCKWRIHDKFKHGIPTSTTIYGYTMHCGTITVIPEEAEVVRMIFIDYIAGMGCNAISRKLNALGIAAKYGGIWYTSGVQSILENDKYTGDLLMQKYYRVDHLTKVDKRNHGECDQYFIPNNHEAIIDHATFERAQELLRERGAKYHPRPQIRIQHAFSGMIVCGNCGGHYIRKLSRGNPFWNCCTTQLRGAAVCRTQKIPDETIRNAAASVLGLNSFDEAVFKAKIASIRVPAFNRLVFVFKDGTEAERTWQYRSRSESWTDEMRRQAGEHAKRGKCR